jgi:hypothetical protein
MKANSPCEIVKIGMSQNIERFTLKVDSNQWSACFDFQRLPFPVRPAVNARESCMNRENPANATSHARDFSRDATTHCPLDHQQSTLSNLAAFLSTGISFLEITKYA